MHIPKTENSSDAQDHARFHESPGKKEQMRTANHECKHSTSLFGLERFAIMQGCTCSEDHARFHRIIRSKGCVPSEATMRGKANSNRSLEQLQPLKQEDGMNKARNFAH